MVTAQAGQRRSPPRCRAVSVPGRWWHPALRDGWHRWFGPGRLWWGFPILAGFLLDLFAALRRRIFLKALLFDVKGPFWAGQLNVYHHAEVIRGMGLVGEPTRKHRCDALLAGDIKTGLGLYGSTEQYVIQHRLRASHDVSASIGNEHWNKIMPVCALTSWSLQPDQLVNVGKPSHQVRVKGMGAVE